MGSFKAKVPLDQNEAELLSEIDSRGIHTEEREEQCQELLYDILEEFTDRCIKLDRLHDCEIDTVERATNNEEEIIKSSGTAWFVIPNSDLGDTIKRFTIKFGLFMVDDLERKSDNIDCDEEIFNHPYGIIRVIVGTKEPIEGA